MPPITLTIGPVARQGEPAGFDSAIVVLPEQAYEVVTGTRTIRLDPVRLMLTAGTHRFARDMGERLHHAEWTITRSPSQVQTLGLMHDCPTCRAGVDQAQAYLREHPDRDVAVGQLWWA